MRRAAAMNCPPRPSAAEVEGDQRSEALSQTVSRQLVLRMSRQAGIVDALHFGCGRPETPRPPSALLQACCIRSGIVPSPRSAEPAIQRAAAQPHAETTPGTRSQTRFVPPRKPRITSLWPFIILVRLSITRSAPNSAGRQTNGVANVLSTSSSASAGAGNARPDQRCRPLPGKDWRSSPRSATACSAAAPRLVAVRSRMSTAELSTPSRENSAGQQIGLSCHTADWRAARGRRLWRRPAPRLASGAHARRGR